MKLYWYCTLSVGKNFVMMTQNPEAGKEMIDKFDYIKKLTAWQKHQNKDY